VKDWIVNASPLILLGKIERLHLLEELAPGFVIPEAVFREIIAGPVVDPAKLWIKNLAGTSAIVPDFSAPLEILAWDLGAGETSVIALGLVRKNTICVLDDLAARNCAEVFGIPVIGTLGILLKAKASGILPLLRPEIERLVESGSMLSTQIIKEVLSLAGESD
jgi:predicted nucleic acid-binding protein